MVDRRTDDRRTDRRVEDALQQALALGEVGVQVAAYLGEELIVDAWAGQADPQRGRAVDGETLFPVFSVTKAVTATALHIQAERGLVQYDAPVAAYWPEFAVHGKAAVTVRHALSHRAGIPQMPEDATAERICDWEWMVTHTAALQPLFTPGTTNAYHSLIWGWIIGEVVRRTDPAHRPFGQFVGEEICAPLGIRDLYLGIPAAEIPRVAPLVGEPPGQNPSPLSALSMPIPVHPSVPVHNRHDVWQSCNPGAGGIMNARSEARFFALLANRGTLGGTRLLSAQRLLDCAVPRDNPYETDAVSGRVSWVGRGGYWLGGPTPPANPLVGTGPRILCHPGAGGSIGWADMDSGLAVAICHNRMHGPWATTVNPFQAIADAVRAVAADRAGVRQPA